ncbi:hypothetical protein Pmani_032899 [Petrolisthes manimaculis]|uniref:Uncharacterized protein n=1 Tax=Petrolisthes manimaculis TaxID=1843537 RepID=A0AAE1TQM2_9EUCA|nr:hypothetical protein Pmani_032899 [Petrolisthes manimaculis]
MHRTRLPWLLWPYRWSPSNLRRPHPTPPNTGNGKCDAVQPVAQMEGQHEMTFCMKGCERGAPCGRYGRGGSTGSAAAPSGHPPVRSLSYRDVTGVNSRYK